MFIVVHKKRPRFIVCVHRSSSWSFTGVQGSSLRSSMFIVASIQRPRFIAVFIGVHRSFNSAPKVHRCVHSCSTLRSSMFIDVHRCSSMFIKKTYQVHRETIVHSNKITKLSVLGSSLQSRMFTGFHACSSMFIMPALSIF